LEEQNWTVKDFLDLPPISLNLCIFLFVEDDSILEKKTKNLTLHGVK